MLKSNIQRRSYNLKTLTTTCLMRNSNTVVLTGMLIIAMVGAPLMAGSAAATQDTSTVITVTDGSGNTIENADVTVINSDTGNSLGTAVSGTSGDANVSWTTSENTTIDVEVQHPDYQSFSANSVLTVSAGASEAYSASLSPELTGDVEVAVVDSSGTPIEGADVASTTGAISGITGTDGLIVATDVPTGDYDLSVSASGYDGASTTVTVSDGSLATPTVTLSDSTNQGTLDVVTVNAASGDPVSDVQITITDDAGAEVAQTVTTDGQMVMDLPGGTYTVTADLPDHAATTREVTVTAGEVTGQEIVIEQMDMAVTAPVEDGDAVDEVYAEFDLSNYSDGENVTVYSDFTLVIADDSGAVTDYVDIGTVDENYEVGADDDLHTVYQQVDGTHDGAVEVVAATDTRLSDAQVNNTGYFVADSGGVGGDLGGIGSDKVLIGAGISIIVLGGAVLVIGRDD